MKLIGLLILALTHMGICQQKARCAEPAVVAASMNAEKCVKQFIELPYWTSEADPVDFRKDEWLKFIQCAELLQSLPDQAKENVLVKMAEYSKKNPHNARETGPTWCKIYILLRVAFDVSPRKDVPATIGFIGSPGGNVLWPLSKTSDGKLKLEHKYQGKMGPPFNALCEYRGLRKQFGSRNLSALRSKYEMPAD